MDDEKHDEPASCYDGLSTPPRLEDDGDQPFHADEPSCPRETFKALTSTDVKQHPNETACEDGPELIRVHGYLHKQGERVIKGPIHKSWKRRYFALEKSKIFYFQNHLDCRQYFGTRDVNLVVGAVDLKAALTLRPSERLDLPHKGFEVVTKRRVWVLCPESEEEYQMWFHALEQSIVQQGLAGAIQRELPNVRVYPMKGVGTYRVLYFCFLLAGLVELFGLVCWFVIGLQPCDDSRRSVECALILGTTLDSLTCQPAPMNGIFRVPDVWIDMAGVGDVRCFHAPPLGQWLSYFCLLGAEVLSVALAALYYLGMWAPVRRGARYLNEFRPPLPQARWPEVDVLICHYSEPAEETIDTLAACLNLEYPPELLHLWVLDDGYCRSTWKAGASVPAIELNKRVIDAAGDLRQEVAQLMYDRVRVHDDMEVYAWRKRHSSAKVPTASEPRVVPRADCAVGSFRDDYRYDTLPHVTFVGRIKPRVHFAKAGNINNCLYNEGAKGKYAVIFDNDMQPHAKFLLATLPFFFAAPGANPNTHAMNDPTDVTLTMDDGFRDDIGANHVAFVQTPQYFRPSSVQLQLGDPLGHRNATFYDAIQTGQDGYECASFAGTNALFRREALDSVGGVQYGSLTEDAYTGQMLTSLGWKALYFRKDFEGPMSERIRLAEGSIPSSVAASLAQRKRWAKGNLQIFLRNRTSLVDPNWHRPEVNVTPLARNHRHRFMHKIVMWNNTIYPIGSFAALGFYYVTLWFLFTGLAPIYLNGLWILVGLVPKLVIQASLAALSNRSVTNQDVVRSQEAWFGYAWVHVLATFEACWWKLTGQDSPWANTGGRSRGSLMELPNVLVWFAAVTGIAWSLIRFFAGYNAQQTSHGASLLAASLLLGMFLVMKLGPMVRMSIQEYFGWSYHSLSDHGNFLGSCGIAVGLAFVAIWVYVEQPTSTPF